MKKINWTVSVYFPATALVVTVILFFWLLNRNSTSDNALKTKKKS